MSSEHLASAQTELKGDLGASWNILDGASSNYTDLGIARRFGGAAAAYSLRDIGAVGRRVVKVRRDSGETNDPEEDFSSNQISSGALEDWVNGKLENTLPADVATAAAAYSLRKTKASYSGNAVRIRRSSDGTEVNVAFDSDDKVGSSSSISIVSGSKTSTDLNGFLNEVLAVGTAVNGTGSFPYDQFTANGNTGFDADNKGGGTSSAGFPYSFGNGDVIVVRYTVSNFDSESGLSPSLRGTTNTSNVTGVTTGGSTFTANGTYTETHTASADGSFLMFADGHTGSYTISNFEIVSHTHQAFVHTWYDQAGSNNAVQATAGNQPQIANNGALLADGVDFDGSNDFLDATSALGATATVGAFIVHKPDTTDARRYFIDNRDGTSDGMRIMQRDEGDGNYRFSINSTEVNSASGSVSTNETLLTAIQSSTAATLFKNAVQQATAADEAISVTAAFRIGANRVSTGTYFDGTMKEIILYTSDQTDNRFKIESNINNYYGLYNDENEVTQTEWQNTGAESFSSTSTDGFSYSNSSGTAFIGVTLSDSLPFGDSVFISFNASGITHPASSDQSPQVRLRDSVSGGDGASPINQVVNGFNAYTLTFNTSKSNADHIVFSEGDTAGGTVTISNFKVSRIARDGLVETWYDQSSNGNDATQGSAGNQPAVVKNGSLSSDGLIFDGSNDFLQTSTQVLTGTETGANSMYAVIKQTSGDAGYVCGSASNTSGSDQIGQSLYGASNDKIVLTNGNDATATGTLDTITRIESENYLLSSNYSNNNENTLKVNGGTTGYANGSTPYNFNAGDRFTIGARKDSTSASTVLFTGSMKEIIAYDADKTSDRVEIETEINNHYNLF